MSFPYIETDSLLLTDWGVLVGTQFVDFRPIDERTPIGTLVKGSLAQYAIPRCGQVQISALRKFRRCVSSENLISDSAEGRATRETTEAKAEGGRTQTKVILSYGDRGWIFSASLKLGDTERFAAWKATLKEDYDSVSYIYRPRNFARALGLMVAEQLGPRHGERTMTSRLGDLKTECTYRSQTVLHGPVVYVRSAYDRIAAASMDVEKVLLPVFVKREEYRAQNEYRFFVMCDEAVSDDEEVVLLDASAAMLDAMCSGRRTEARFGAGISESGDLDSVTVASSGDGETVGETLGELVEEQLVLATSLTEEAQDGRIPAVVRAGGLEDVPGVLTREVETYRAVDTVWSMAAGSLLSRRPMVRTAALFAEQFVRALCEVFEEPISRISIDEKDRVVLEIRFPKGPYKGTFAWGPDGRGQWRVAEIDEAVRHGLPAGGISLDPRQLGGHFERILEQCGLARRVPNGRRMQKK